MYCDMSNGPPNRLPCSWKRDELYQEPRGAIEHQIEADDRPRRMRFADAPVKNPEDQTSAKAS